MAGPKGSTLTPKVQFESLREALHRLPGQLSALGGVAVADTLATPHAIPSMVDAAMSKVFLGRPFGKQFEANMRALPGGSKMLEIQRQASERATERGANPLSQLVASVLAPGPGEAASAGKLLTSLGDLNALKLAGISVFHGTGAGRFAKFDPEKIGTGQGAQSFGFGHYFAENPKVAKSYRTSVGTPKIRGLTDEDMNNIPVGLVDELLDDGGIKAVDNWIAQFEDATDVRAETIKPVLQKLKSQGQVRFDSRPSLLDIDIDVTPDELLDWDLPLSKQSKGVKEALTREVPMSRHGGPGALFTKDELENETMTAGEWIQGMRDEADPQAISGMLHEAGIPGSRYLDKGSRPQADDLVDLVLNRNDIFGDKKKAAGVIKNLVDEGSITRERGDKALGLLRGEGTRNIVMFPGTESRIKILEPGNQ